MKTRTLAPGAYLARSGQGVSLYDAEGKCFAMNKMGGSILALALTGLSAEQKNQFFCIKTNIYLLLDNLSRFIVH